MYDTSKTGYMSCNIHAETNALKRLKSDADTLFVVRRDMNGRLTMAKPCNVCMAAIRQTNIRKIFFSNERGEIEMIKL
jgi:deoxycytidylate deaminase